MDQVVKEYEGLIYSGSPSWCLINGSHHYTHHCGCLLMYKSPKTIAMIFNFRKWNLLGQQWRYINISNGKRQITATVPTHYFYTQLISELSYQSNDIIFWQWILRHFLEINELRLMIIYQIINPCKG